MNISNLDYTLPKNLIAQSPIYPRDHSKLMAIDRDSGKITNHIFYEIIELLTPNDVLVFNNSKVFPARLNGIKNTGGTIELLLLEEKDGIWKAMHKGKASLNSQLTFGNLTAKVVGYENELILVDFNKKGKEFWKELDKTGITPLPPYINSSEPELTIRKKYQTVYADPVGSVAAPTAGFHFTEKLLDALKTKGVQTEFVTLHVGLGTFQPIKTDDITHHPMHSEYYELTSKTAKRLNEAKKSGKRIISVGTTATRVLESCSSDSGIISEGAGETDIFIFPPYKFKFVDALITNFHLPKSTLLALISAFTSSPNTDKSFTDFSSSLVGTAYANAIKKNYRFYSFGDAMLIF